MTDHRDLRAAPVRGRSGSRAVLGAIGLAVCLALSLPTAPAAGQDEAPERTAESAQGGSKPQDDGAAGAQGQTARDESGAGAKADDAGAGLPDVRLRTLGAKAYERLTQGEPANRVFSPVSLELAIALVGEGATEEWRANIGDVLGLRYDELAAIDDAARSETARLVIANALWASVGMTVSPSYAERLFKDYDSEIKEVDFAGGEALQRINGWASERTDGAIPQVLDDLPAQAALVFTNVFYMKAAWLRPFDPEQTAAADFARADGSSVEVAMMRRQGRFPYLVTGNGQLVKLFYEDTNLALTLYLSNPDAEPAAAAREAMAALFAAPGDIPARSRTGTVALPRFTMEGDFDLTRLLGEIGLSEMLGNTQVIRAVKGPMPPAISQIVQRTKLKIDEEGTVAAAATAAVGVRSADMNAFEFVADRPFHFALHHGDVPTPLLVGYVADPS